MSKIYQIITSVQLGGAENVAINLAKHCYSNNGNFNNVELVIVELYPSKNDYAISLKKELNLINIPVKTLFNSKKRLSLFFAPFMLMKLILKDKPAIIHSHTDLPDFVLSVCLKMCSILKNHKPKIIRTIHSTQLWRSHNKTGKLTESSFNNEYIAAVSQEAMNAYEHLRVKYNLPISNQRQIIYNGLSVINNFQHPFKIDNNKINISFCGRFEDYKGMDVLIPAIKEIERRYPSRFLFHIIGNGTYKNDLLQLSKYSTNVIMYEPIPNVSSYFHVFDYMFMPSHFEGLALISIEASLSKTPVIASYAPGLDETLPSEWPLRFNRNNTEELYDLFDEIHKSEIDLVLLKQMAYTYASKMFSLDKMIKSYTKLYDEIL